MTTAEALTAAKNRLAITGTDFDTILTDFFDVAVDRLYPKVQKEIAAQEKTVTVDDYGEATVDLSTLATPLDDVRLVESYVSTTWDLADSIFRHGTILRVRSLSTEVTKLKLYGLKAYVVAGSTTDIPERFELPVVWFMMSEFFDYLAGNKGKFNVYMQANGGRAIEDLREEAQYYEIKAEAYIEEKAQLYGSQ